MLFDAVEKTVRLLVFSLGRLFLAYFLAWRNEHGCSSHSPHSSCSQPCLDASLVLIRRRSHLLRLLEEIADPRGLCMVIAQQEAHQAIRIEGLHRARFRKALRRPASMSSGESGLLARAFDESIPNTCCKVSEPLTYQWEFGKTPCACATLKPWSRREALS